MLNLNFRKPKLFFIVLGQKSTRGMQYDVDYKKLHNVILKYHRHPSDVKMKAVGEKAAKMKYEDGGHCGEKAARIESKDCD